MIKTFLASLEDPQRPLIAPNYWILKKMGFVLPENTIAKSLYIMLHALATIFVISQFVELYVIRANLDLVLTNLKISMLSLVCVTKAITFLLRQQSWNEVLRYVTEADIFERNNADTSNGKIVNEYTKYCRRLTHFVWVLVYTTVVTTELQPLILYLTSITHREGYHNGTEGFPHIFSSWMPFDKEHSPGSWMTVLWHTLVCFYGSSVIAAYDTSVLTIMVFFGGKLDLLRVRCKMMLGQGGAGISTNEADAVVKELHQIHVQLIKHSQLFNSLLSPVMFLYIIVCSLMLCASAFQLTSVTNTAQKLLLAQYLIFGVAQLFLFCWHSNDVLIKSENVSLGPYESEWWSAGASLQQRRHVLMLSGQLRIHNTFSAGPFVDLTLATFITILKGAYSYYTLLRK